ASQFVTIHKRDEGSGIIAPIHLPHNVKMSEIKIFYKNDNDDNHEFKVVLQRKNLLTASMNDIYTFSSNDGSNNMQVETGDLTSNSLNQRIIDNSQYSYRVLVF